MEIRGASALVTGAGRGIGRAIARALGREGAHVTAVSRTKSELESLVREIQADGGRAHPFPADLRNAADCDAAIAAAVANGGGLRVLVNNAGVGGFASVAETTDELWERILATNLTAVFRLTRAALPHLARQGGHVFMVSSLAGQNPIAGMAAYCASKAALDHFSACLMLEVRQQGVKVTTLAPGSVDTEFVRDGGLAHGRGSWKLSPDDLAGTVVDLLRTRDDAHLSRVELRPLRPPSKA
jgi:NAD(P)-dependent dehydrogenase (short-subunit alcohol dehydrogenase family)